MRVVLTGGQVLDDHGGSGVEDDVSTVVEVMQVVATVEASVAKDVLQDQLLKTKRDSYKQLFKVLCQWTDGGGSY